MHPIRVAAPVAAASPSFAVDAQQRARLPIASLPPRNNMMKKTLALLALCAAAGAQAHVTLEYQVAVAASSYKASFKVGHGCGESATRQLVVQVPAAMRHPHPMPKPGWNLDIQREGDTVTRITWTARTREDALPSAQYDEFVLVAQTPAQAGPVYWPVSQVCEDGRQDWTAVPGPGQKLSDLKTPAALLEVLPADGAAQHHH
jgi:uncharacterized protein YcnI